MSKIQPRHLKRTAYLYVRQSSMRQVIENTESTKRQYGLQQRAVSLGWPPEQVRVIDTDQGESGTSTVDRHGFQQLVAEVSMGRAGIVMGLEVSRLARNSADWHRLLEICAVTDTLILDEDGIYDAANFNDRLLLGMKGAMSEAEIYVIKSRLRGGINNKAQRGEYRMNLPIGLVYTDSGDVMLDPDQQIQHAVRLVFSTFRRTGAAHATVRAFHAEGLLFPKKHLSGEVTLRTLSHATVLGILHNPRYAGAYAFGRTKSRKTADGRDLRERLERNSWMVFIPDAHPGYVSLADFEENQLILAGNDARGMRAVRCGPRREGSALLQGLAICGRCGQRMSISYETSRKKIVPRYNCQQATASRGLPVCQSVLGTAIDHEIGARLVGVVTPAAIEAAFDVQREVKRRIDEADQLRLRSVERAQYQADASRRRFMRVDPDNRLVADELEREWNERLQAVEQTREAYERLRKKDQLKLDLVEQQRIAALAADFPRLWADPKLPNRERKRIVALIIEDVTLKKGDETVTADVRFKGGRTERIEVERAKCSWEIMRARPELVAEVDRLLDSHANPEIARILNERHVLPPGAEVCGNTEFSGADISRLIANYRLVPRYQRLRAAGLLTTDEMCARLGVSRWALGKLNKNGRVASKKAGTRKLYEPCSPASVAGTNERIREPKELQYAE